MKVSEIKTFMRARRGLALVDGRIMGVVRLGL
jgi:hypothetical protein